MQYKFNKIQQSNPEVASFVFLLSFEPITYGRKKSTSDLLFQAYLDLMEKVVIGMLGRGTLVQFFLT